MTDREIPGCTAGQHFFLAIIQGVRVISFKSRMSEVGKSGLPSLFLGLLGGSALFLINGTVSAAVVVSPAYFHSEAGVSCNPNYSRESETYEPGSVAIKTTCPGAAPIGSSAAASPGFQLRASSYGKDQPLGWHTGASAFQEQSYKVNGLPRGQAIPINFNFSVSGSMSATSSPRGGIATSRTQIWIESTDHTGFWKVAYSAAEMRSVYGLSSYESEGAFFGSVEPITANFRITQWDGEILRILEGEDLERVLNDPVVRIKIAAAANPIASGFFTGDGAVAELANRIKSILVETKPWLKAVSIDVQYGYDGTWTLSQDISSSGFVGVRLRTGVAPYPRPSEGEADFGSTVSLESITFRDGFDPSGLGDLYVNFADGTQYKITQQSTDIDEPPTRLSLVTGLIILAGFQIVHRRSRSRSPKLQAACDT